MARFIPTNHTIHISLSSLFRWRLIESFDDMHYPSSQLNFFLHPCYLSYSAKHSLKCLPMALIPTHFSGQKAHYFFALYFVHRLNPVTFVLLLSMRHPLKYSYHSFTYKPSIWNTFSIYNINIYLNITMKPSNTLKPFLM